MKSKQWEEMEEMVWHHCKTVIYVQCGIIHPLVFHLQCIILVLHQHPRVNILTSLP